MRHARLFVVTILLLIVVAGCAGDGGMRGALQKLKESYKDSVTYQPVAQ